MVTTPESRGVRRPIEPQRILGMATGALIAITLAATMLLDESVSLRNLSIFGGVVVLLSLNAMVSRNLTTWLEPDLFGLLTLLFLANGMLALAASLLDLYPHFPLLPRRSDYVLRHAYFIIVWLPCLIGSFQVWDTILPLAIPFFFRYGPLILVALAVTDIGSALLFADPAQAWDGYLYYVDKITLQFFIAVSFLFSALFAGRGKLVLIIMIPYLMLCRGGNVGTMFNTTNSLLSFLVLVVSIFPWVRPRGRVLILGSICGGLLMAMCAGIVSPRIYAGADNNSWSSRRAADAVFRAQAWRQNLSDLSDSNFAGVGFGVPYFALTRANLLAVEAADWSEEAGIPATAPPSEFLYIRGQHSSIVNVFYRLGLLGGIFFLVLNVIVFIRLAAAATTADMDASRLSVSAAALFAIAFMQIAVNVGLESPPVFLVYILAMSFSLWCLEYVGIRKHRMLRVPRPPARAQGLPPTC